MIITQTLKFHQLKQKIEFVGVSLCATYICDTSPPVSRQGGFALVDGDTLNIQANLGKVELRTSVLEMVITAIDASNNISQ